MKQVYGNTHLVEIIGLSGLSTTLKVPFSNKLQTSDTVASSHPSLSLDAKASLKVERSGGTPVGDGLTEVEVAMSFSTIIDNKVGL